MFKVNKNINKLTVSHTIRFTEELYEKLQALSTKEDVPFNTLILQCCQYALDNLSQSENN